MRRFTAAQLAAIVQAMHPIMGAVNRNEQGQGGFNLKPYGQVLDTSTKCGLELYGQAIRKFEPVFDREQEKLHAFVDKIRQRASHLNCTEIFNVPIVDVLGAEQLMYNLFEDYTTITLNQTRNAAIARWSVNNWQKQASYIMGLATLESLGENFCSRVADHQEKYSITDNNVQCVDGPLLLKAIHTLVQPETGYSAFTLIQELNTITLENHDNNVINLNKEVRALIRRIRATKDGKHSLPDQTIVYYLLQAYKKARCDDFKYFIDQMKNSGVPSMELLISRAECKYIDLVKFGKWNATPKGKIILALRAKTEAPEKKNKKRKKEKSSKEKVKKGSKRKSKSNLKRVTFNDKDESWILEKPKGSDLKKVIVRDDKKWNWCSFHKK